MAGLVGAARSPRFAVLRAQALLRSLPGRDAVRTERVATPRRVAQNARMGNDARGKRRANRPLLGLLALLAAGSSCANRTPAPASAPIPSASASSPTIASGCPAPSSVNVNDARPGNCASDGDCTQGLRARCGVIPTYEGPGKPHFAGWMRACVSDECVRDADCGTGQLCHCGTRVGWTNECAPGECRADSDCASGTCAAADHRPWLASLPPPNYTVKYCRTARDACSSDTACGRGACEYLVTNRRFECVDSQPSFP